MLFPIILSPFLGEGSNRKYFIEIIHNNIVKREMIDRLLVNGKDKLILRDYEGFQTEKDVTEFSELKFEDKCKKSCVTIKDYYIYFNSSFANSLFNLEYIRFSQNI